MTGEFQRNLILPQWCRKELTSRTVVRLINPWGSWQYLPLPDWIWRKDIHTHPEIRQTKKCVPPAGLLQIPVADWTRRFIVHMYILDNIMYISYTFTHTYIHTLCTLYDLFLFYIPTIYNMVCRDNIKFFIPIIITWIFSIIFWENV